MMSGLLGRAAPNELARIYSRLEPEITRRC